MGASPTASQTVKVHYEGRLVDGTVFDSSIQRGEPIEFPLDRVIKVGRAAAARPSRLRALASRRRALALLRRACMRELAALPASVPTLVCVSQTLSLGEGGSLLSVCARFCVSSH